MKRCLHCDHTFDSPLWKCPACGWKPAEKSGNIEFAPELAKENDNFPEAGFQTLYKHEAGHFWFRNRNRVIAWALRKSFPNTRSLCEIGCGTGFVLSGIWSAFPEIRLTGTEIYTTGLRHAAERNPDIELYQMDARRLPYKDEFDVIGAFDVLEHIEEDQAVLEEMYKAVKPGGGILVTVPQHPWLWSAEDEAALHKRRYTMNELKSKVEQAGFILLITTSFVSLLLPLMAISRLSPKRGEPDPLREFRIHRGVNFVLERVLDAERWMIGAGIRFPAGGSLLLAAEKPI